MRRWSSRRRPFDQRQRAAGRREKGEEIPDRALNRLVNCAARAGLIRISRPHDRARIHTAARREEANDYYRVLAMVPVNFLDRDAIVARIFEDLLSGSLKREDVRSRVKYYIAEHNRMFPKDFAKFGDSKLVSLNAAVDDDGATTLGDTISRGLWD